MLFIAIKILLYLVAAHVFYNNGFGTESHLFDFIVLMSLYILIDVCSYFGARQSLLQEIFLEDEEES